MQRIISLGLFIIFFTPLALGLTGCAGPKHEGGSTYEKSKSDYEKPREGSSGY